MPAHPQGTVTTAPPVFDGWPAEATRHWNQRPLLLAHNLHRHPLFSLSALAALIDRYPREAYALVQTSQDAEGPRRWREGDIAGVPGAQVIDMIASGSLWLNLRDVGGQDRHYGELLEAAYADMAARVPGFQPRALKMGILISSPRARVHYHCDLPGQALWQIQGRKRVFVYPPHPPFLDARALEDIAYSGFEFKLGYERGFDDSAEVFELAPGAMLTWPLNAPHRIVNLDCLNISVTTEHWTPANQRAQRLHLAHAILRHRLRWTARSQALSGPVFLAKSVLQALWRRSPWAARLWHSHRPVTFRLSPGQPGGIEDIPPTHP